MDSSSLLRAAIDEARGGNRKKSRLLLQQFLQDEPRHETAWLWLSKVSDRREDKIAALEMALSINPSRAETAVSLKKLKQQRPAQKTNLLDDMYRQAIAVYRDGRSLRARLLLHQIVDKNQNYAKAWFALGQIEPKIEDRLFALTVGLHLKSNNQKARAALAEMEADKFLDHFALAQRFETFGLQDTAVTYYQKAQQHAFQTTVRQSALEKQQQLEQKIREALLITTTPTANLIRLTAGPIVLYFLLIVIVSGINPLNISLPLLIGGFVVSLGSFFIASANQNPTHPVWQPLLGDNDHKKITLQYLLTGIGIALLLLPFAALFLSNANEFMTYYAIQPINFSH